VVIDVSAPAGTLAHARICADYGVPLVSGVTGLSAAEMAELRRLAARIPMLHARNLSPGMAALLALLPALAAALAGYDLEIVETHHRHKRDAPSGTALALAEAAAGGAPVVLGRGGIAPRADGEIGIHAVRGGGNPGEHAVIFAADGEEVRVCHRAFSRRAYADGALRAAAWIVGQPAGWYGMVDLSRGAPAPTPTSAPAPPSAAPGRTRLAAGNPAGA
jgi:4-hydroxy-tetrahydrodipicolinate reductase